MISLENALDLIRSLARPIGVETVALEFAATRVLAAPVIARIDSPRRDCSAMDGFAVCGRDLAKLPASLRILGKSFPGNGWNGTIEPGTCVRIFTGAAVPEGADRVVMQEHVQSEGALAFFDKCEIGARYIRKQGSDFRTGDEILSKGSRLDAGALIAVGGADVDRVDVFRRARLYVVSTGDELVDPGTASGTFDARPESLSLGVAALAQQWGATFAGRARLRDDLPAMMAAAAATCDLADVIVVTGGASVGEKDFAKEIFAPVDLRMIFSKLAMKPGMPTWLGVAGDTFVLGLPGNPSSALVSARLLLAPLLSLLHGRAAENALEWRSARLGSDLQAAADREIFHRARLCEGIADVLAFQESFAQIALAQANALVRQEAGSPRLIAGADVQILDL